MPDHPVHASVRDFATLAHNDVFYFFGGYWWKGHQSIHMKSIWSLNPVSKTWTNVGEMKVGRLYHSVIVLDNFILIAGTHRRSLQIIHQLNPELKKGLSLS